MNKTNNTTTQIRKGVLDFFILSMLASKSMYPREIIEALNAHGLNLVEGTIYPLFLRLHKNGFVKYRWIEASGHPRKYYNLTPRGIEALKNYEKEWHLMNTTLAKIKQNQV